MHLHHKKVDDIIADTLSMAFTSEPGTKELTTDVIQTQDPQSRVTQISQDILQLAQELVDLQTRKDDFEDVQFELIQP